MCLCVRCCLFGSLIALSCFACLLVCLIACLIACVRAVVLSIFQCNGESNAAVAEHGLWAIEKLAVDDANRTKLGEGGACTSACSIKFVRVCE